MRLFGKRSVMERLRSNPQSVKRIYLLEGNSFKELAGVQGSQRIPVEHLTERRFMQLAHKAQAQGVIAEVDEFKYQDFDEMIDPAGPLPTLLLLDRINDPQNLGSILRGCACLGGFGVVLPRHESVSVTEAVVKVACGGENYVPICIVSNLSVAIDKAKRAGYWIGATVIEDGRNPREVELNFPLGLVFGSEGEGIRPGLLKEIDYSLTLPMQGAGLSFNVAMAVSIFCYEVYNQRAHYEKTKKQ